MPTAGGEEASKTAEEPGFDQVLERLRAVVERLEDGKLTLEESLAAYEEGVTLARRGHALLDSAEKRVELLVRVGEGGPETVPLSPRDTGEGDNGAAGADAGAGDRGRGR